MPPDVLVILCDTARADAFQPWNESAQTPITGRLASQGLCFSQAIAPAPWTLPSTASIFSGRLPTEHGISGDGFRWEDGRPTSPTQGVRSLAGPWLPETFRARGYRTWAASANGWVSRWGGFDRGFDEFIDLRESVGTTKGPLASLGRAKRLAGIVDRGGRQAIRRFTAAAGRNGAPLFAFVNLMEVHTPYDPPRPFYPDRFWSRPASRRLSSGPESTRRFLRFNAGLDEPSEDFVARIRSLYLQSARYEDWLLGGFVDALQARGRPTVLALVSDHGENLGEHGLFVHNSSLHQTLLHVPLVLWGWNVEVGPGRLDEPVSLLHLGDWLRSLADGEPLSTSGQAVVSEYESTSRQRPIPPDLREQLVANGSGGPPPLFFHAGMAVQKGPLKYVATELGQESLFDLSADPGEHRDLLEGRPSEETGQFAPFAEAWRDRRRRQPSHEAGDVAEEEIAQQLRALGYID